MLNNFFKVALRNILRHKGYSFINIFGLAIGLASFLLILLFVKGELSYDRYHSKADRVHRVAFKFNVGSNQFDVAQGPSPLGATMVEYFPEVVQAARIYSRDDVYLSYEDQQFRETEFFWVDSTIFELFDIPLVMGDASTALEKANSIVITTGVAEKYFGPDDPMGKTLVYEDGSLYRVTGVAEESPANTHFHYDFLASLSSLPEVHGRSWDNMIETYNYILLAEGATAEQVEAKFPDFQRKYLAGNIERWSSSTYDEFLAAGNYLRFYLQPLTAIHLESNINNELETNGSYTTVIVFAAIALLILIVACINFVNLATARSTERANEVGVRKAIGSSRRQLVWQFLAETILLSAIAVILSVIITGNFIPLFNSVLSTNLDELFFTEWYFLPGVILLTLLVGTVAGMYPAFVLSSFRPVAVLKGKHESSSRGRIFRGVLVIFQFVASIVLFIGTIVISNQLDYCQSKELGYNKENVVVISGAEVLNESSAAFKNELVRGGGIAGATYSSGLPNMRLTAQVFQKEGDQSDEYHTLLNIMTDFDFMDTYKVQMVQGRFFDVARATDSSAIILNETAVKAIGLENPLGKRLTRTSPDTTLVFTIVGVVRDLHIQPLQDAIRPMVFTVLDELPTDYLSVLIEPGRTAEVLGRVESMWGRFVPQKPVDLVFYDDFFVDYYSQELQTSKVLKSFALLAIVIACLGLFGLASFTVGRRSKEIGIRKVLGASVSEVVLLLSKEFVKWVLIANVLAWPIAYYVMKRWLEGFAYRTDFGVGVFIIAGVAAMAIALLTVSYQAINAARSNPVDSIQYQ